MGEEEEFWAEAKAAVMVIKRQAEDREIKAQRATVPGLGGYKTKENRSIELTDLDRKFLAYVRGQVGPSEMKSLVEDDTGRILVSPEIEREIGRRLQEEVTIRQLAAIKTITKDRLTVREYEEEPTVSWGKLETGPVIAESHLKPASPAQTKYICDLYGLTKIGEDELMDSDDDLAAMVAEAFAKSLAEKENDAFINGRGWTTFQEPEGIVVNATLVANKVSTAAVGAVTVEDALDMVYAVPKKYRKSGSFIVHSLTELALRKLRARGGSESDGLEGPFLWQPAVALGAPNTFLGRPIYTDDSLGTLAGAAEIIAIYGDFKSGYQIVDRVGLSIQRLSELYAEAGLVGFKLHARVTGFCRMPQNKPLVLMAEHAA